MLGYQTLEAELAGFAKQVWSDFSLFKLVDEDALWPTRGHSRGWVFGAMLGSVFAPATSIGRSWVPAS
jgi:hypothetical protein